MRFAFHHERSTDAALRSVVATAADLMSQYLRELLGINPTVPHDPTVHVLLSDNATHRHRFPATPKIDEVRVLGAPPVDVPDDDGLDAPEAGMADDEQWDDDELAAAGVTAARIRRLLVEDAIGVTCRGVRLGVNRPAGIADDDVCVALNVDALVVRHHGCGPDASVVKTLAHEIVHAFRVHAGDLATRYAREVDAQTYAWMALTRMLADPALGDVARRARAVQVRRALRQPGAYQHFAITPAERQLLMSGPIPGGTHHHMSVVRLDQAITLATFRLTVDPSLDVACGDTVSLYEQVGSDGQPDDFHVAGRWVVMGVDDAGSSLPIVTASRGLTPSVVVTVAPVGTIGAGTAPAADIDPTTLRTADELRLHYIDHQIACCRALHDRARSHLPPLRDWLNEVLASGLLDERRELIAQLGVPDAMPDLS
jgi:hypothetical protein